MIDGRNFFDQPVIKNLRAHDNIRKISIGQDYDYTIGCLLDYPCFKKYYKLTAIDLSKQQKLDADPKALRQINFAGNLERAGNAQIFFRRKSERNSFRYFKRNSQSITILFCFNIILM